MFCFNDFDPKMFRFLRILICLFLVLCILVNCSPLRARASGIAVGIGIGVTTIAGLIALAYGVQISPDRLPSAASDLETALNNGVSSGALTKDVLDLWWTAASGGKIKLETANRAIADIVVDWVSNQYNTVGVPVTPYYGTFYSADTIIPDGLTNAFSYPPCSSLGEYSRSFSVPLFIVRFAYDNSVLDRYEISTYALCTLPLTYIPDLKGSFNYDFDHNGTTFYYTSSTIHIAKNSSASEILIPEAYVYSDKDFDYVPIYRELFSNFLSGVYAPVSLPVGGLHGVITDGTGALKDVKVPDLKLVNSSHAGGLYGSNDDDGYINDNILSAGSFIWADLIADLGGKSATITIEDEEGKTHVYPITDTGLGDEILTPSETLPGTGTETGVGTAPVSDFLSWLYDLLIRALQWLVEALGLRALAEWLVEVLLGGITGILDNVVELILAGIKAIFVPSTDYLTAKVEALRARFGFMDSVLATGEAIIAALNLSGTPPVIYAHFENAEGAFNWGGTVAVLDMTWYSRYKAAGDAFLSGVIWIFFLWRVFIKLPSIISGVGGTVRTFDSIDSGK